MRWEITDYVFTMRISFFKRKTQQKRCQTFFVFPSGWGGIEKRRHVRSSLTTCLSDCCLCGFDIHHRCFFGRQLVLESLRSLVKGAQESGDATFRVQFPITPGMFDFLSSNSCVCGRSLKK